MVMTNQHTYPPPITLIKEKNDGKSEGYSVKLKLNLDPTPSTLEIYEFKTSLFDNGDPEDFKLFFRNVDMTLVASGMLEAGAKYQYLCTLVHGEALHKYYLLSADIVGMETIKVDYIIRGIVQYFLL